MPKVLISDKLDPLAIEIFKKAGVEVDFKAGLSPAEQLAIIDQYDGLAIRSETKVNAAMIAAAKNLKVIGRAGIGVDNVDIPAATNAGIVVMNTPFGNSITTAEHAIAMMFSLARQIPQANASTHAGKWEKSKFMGTELYNKTLGVIGCGNIGSIVADRALGLKMKVIAYDPFLTAERAQDIGVEKVELEEIYARSDFITIHVPKNDKTSNMINAETIAQMKDGVYIINCARGGLIVEADLKAALDSGKVAGAGLDVFEVEPAKENILFNHPRLICTPHLGASTTEAQVNVALQVAEQMADYLMNGAVTNALNMPSISAEDAPRLKPYLALGAQLGEFAGQITDHAIQGIEIEYEGTVTDINTDPITSVIIAHLLGAQTESINMVNALKVAEARGIKIKQSYDKNGRNWRSMINLIVKTTKRTRNVTGTLFTGKEPRVVNIEGVPVEAALTRDMLFIRNKDKLGLIGGLGMILADGGQNIADFRLGRVKAGETAVCLVSLDAPLPDDLFEKVEALPQIESVKRLRF
ncbi:MAG: phosphoglycerate dehydrogenase [Alphaproteobacteria bacterium]|nr:phosphoglycerate dehydrogenase [Alphaproteobacteria bacterium]MBP7757977.1 phosphoglycerate dehydrogenase [Alphaproteobacteria bacterium]MBP7761304.1 phosphoglycerate dehydrogenase [Alphaproteobacteria bacterium]MBP7903754.1 phosphoglycerate dehydrogenase [Alphaproteobacteria bacterium]